MPSRRNRAERGASSLRVLYARGTSPQPGRRLDCRWAGGARPRVYAAGRASAHQPATPTYVDIRGDPPSTTHVIPYPSGVSGAMALALCRESVASRVTSAASRRHPINRHPRNIPGKHLRCMCVKYFSCVVVCDVCASVFGWFFAHAIQLQISSVTL